MIIIDEADDISDELLKSLNKRVELCKNVPPCPKCNSNDIQLVQWVSKIEWRCRTCKERYGSK